MGPIDGSDGGHMRAKADLPYYDGHPVELRTRDWLLVVLSVLAGFALLIGLRFQTFPLSLIGAILFTGVPLLTLGMVSAGNQGALFPRFGPRELAQAGGFGALTLIISFLVGAILLQFVPMASNPTAGTLADATPATIAIFMVRTAIQLLGEELLTILPLLAVLWLCVAKFGLSRRVGLIAAVIVSTLGFAAVHLPTYGWNVVQCFVGIGAARLVLTMAFLVTRNLWVSFGAHIVNDWTEFLLPTLLGLGHGPIEPGA